MHVQLYLRENTLYACHLSLLFYVSSKVHVCVCVSAIFAAFFRLEVSTIESGFLSLSLAQAGVTRD